MPLFRYRARDRAGALVTGSLEADNKALLETSLDKMGLIPISVAEGRPSFQLTDIKKYFEKAEQTDVILFSRQLATLFSAGIPLTKALSTLERQFKSPAFTDILRRLRNDIEGGSSFAAALAKHPKVFPEIYSNMVEAGEAGGILDSVLDRLALMFEKNAENKAKVKSATLYPKIVVGAIVVAIIILMNFVVPRFAKLYAGFNVDLPLPTRLLIKFSTIFNQYWYIVLFVSTGFFLAGRLYLRSETGAREWDGIKLKIPVFGPLMLKSILSRFSRVLGALYKSGLPILQSLDIASRSVENRVIAAEIKLIEDYVRAGKSISEPMTESSHFPPMVAQMVAVGEETGNLDVMLEKTAEYYDREVDSAIRNLTTSLEPLLLAFIFGIVLFLALAIFLPMWDILKVVRR